MLLHVDIFVNSMEEMIDFYCGKLGMEIVADHVVSGELVRFASENRYDSYRIVLLRISKSGAMIELLQYVKYGVPCKVIEKRSATITLLTLSIENKIKQLKQLGVERESEIFEVDIPKAGKSRIVFYKDPEGNRIEFLQMVEEFT
ncbi:VOC family protein [[Clostridium] polysaccharolyticum]|uniref:Catechol 2,3-dioxygenase n=1 Tax=[Clostridium] polysaccharolyticum TaxID=29364 RepID=A0A1I0C464_9FIRM|nr:VOC family protein [[Clostridium] polysaccharolyticum]SET14222.1 Catechol 2,3-dioxygenase [[Clostridium] polysaccharolyticum]